MTDTPSGDRPPDGPAERWTDEDEAARRAEARADAAKAAAREAARAADPVLKRRARIARLVSIGQRVGYSLFAVAVVAFGVGFAAGFTSWVVTLILACMLVGSLVLAPAIVFGYAVKAADRDDREHGR